MMKVTPDAQAYDGGRTAGAEQSRKGAVAMNDSSSPGSLSDPPAIWSEDEVGRVLDMATAIASQRQAFEALATGEAQLAEKVSLAHAGTADRTLSYLSKLSPAHGAVSKLVAVHPGNATRGLPTVTGTVLVLDNHTGQLVAVLPATSLTGIRTAAGSAVAADALARADAGVLGVLGSGVQARGHVHAIAQVRRLREVRMYSPHAARREAAAAELSGSLGIRVEPVSSARAAVADADIVATCTLSTEPVVATDDLMPGTTVLSVGSFAPDRSEVEPQLMRRAATVVVDDVATALEHAGPVVRAVRDGVLSAADLTTIGSVLVGHASGRRRDDDIVFYNSVGLGVQDAAAAHAVLEIANSY